MDMGIRLNLSYPVAKPVGEAAASDQGQSKVADTANTTPAQVVQSTTQSKGVDQESTNENVKAAAQEIQDFFQSVKRNLEFSVDDRSGKVVVKVIASDSGEVIRQIPNEEVLKLADSLSDASSMLFSAKA